MLRNAWCQTLTAYLLTALREDLGSRDCVTLDGYARMKACGVKAVVLWLKVIIVENVQNCFLCLLDYETWLIWCSRHDTTGLQVYIKVDEYVAMVMYLALTASLECLAMLAAGVVVAVTSPRGLASTPFLLVTELTPSRTVDVARLAAFRSVRVMVAGIASFIAFTGFTISVLAPWITYTVHDDRRIIKCKCTKRN